MTAVAKLPEKWREEAADHDRHKDPLPASILRECADELEAALSPAELGGSELPVGEVSDGFSGHQRAVNLYGPIRCQPAPGTKLYTTPRAAEAVTDEMVDSVRADIMQAAANDGRLHIVLKDEWVRDALNAALTPRGSDGRHDQA